MAEEQFDWICIVFFLAAIDPNSFGLVGKKNRNTNLFGEEISILHIHKNSFKESEHFYFFLGCVSKM